MKRRKMWTTALTLVLALTCLSFRCGGGPPEDQRRKLVKAADDIAGGISAMIDAKRDLAGKGRITQDEDRRLTQLLTVANDADGAFISRLKSTTVIDASNRADLLSLLSKVTAAVNDLNSSGILRIGNADAQKKLSRIMSSITAAINILAQLQTAAMTPTH
ncbi:MAG TPA: hypothetical protein VHU19_04455 [Pyrinomonadaceae bacterium]|jgi:hypothetical protein|nr:hypothetical protein [Pyrinomonadaceae bacterium]